MSYPPLASNDTQFQPHLHCPKCGATTVVTYGSKYICLSCEFSKNVAEPEPEPDSNIPLLSIIGLVLLTLLLL